MNKLVAAGILVLALMCLWVAFGTRSGLAAEIVGCMSVDEAKTAMNEVGEFISITKGGDPFWPDADQVMTVHIAGNVWKVPVDANGCVSQIGAMVGHVKPMVGA